jgi:hypothetical protein
MQMSNKRNAVLYLDKELVEKSRNFGFNLSKTFENHLKTQIAQFSTVSSRNNYEPTDKKSLWWAGPDSNPNGYESQCSHLLNGAIFVSSDQGLRLESLEPKTVQNLHSNKNGSSQIGAIEKNTQNLLKNVGNYLPEAGPVGLDHKRGRNLAVKPTLSRRKKAKTLENQPNEEAKYPSLSDRTCPQLRE